MQMFKISAPNYSKVKSGNVTIWKKIKIKIAYCQSSL